MEKAHLTHTHAGHVSDKDAYAGAIAPLRMQGTYTYRTTADKLWPLVTDAAGIAQWFPIITGGRFDHRPSKTPNACGVGSKRYCKTLGMGTLDETIRYWREPHQVAYTVKNPFMPIKDHHAVMTLMDTDHGQVAFTWEQYYNLKGLLMRHFFPAFMCSMMNRGLRQLQKRLGGQGGQIHLVKSG